MADQSDGENVSADRTDPIDPHADAERRQRGRANMRAVYGWDFEPTKPFEISTVDHLFGEVWEQGDLSIKERRLLLIGLAVGTGQLDVAGLQIGSALSLGELSPDDLRTVVLFLAHYAGWPRAAALNSEVEKLIAKHTPVPE